MTSSSDEVRCTVRDGAVWMHLDDVRVNIPSDLVNKSQVLMDAMSCVDDSSSTGDLTLPAPKEWLQAWLACYGSEQERLRCADMKDLVNCLLVRFSSKCISPIMLKRTRSIDHTTGLSNARRCTSKSAALGLFSSNHAKCLSDSRRDVRCGAAVTMSLHLLVLLQKGLPDSANNLLVYQSHGPNTLS
jgi:hypothetical protein